MVYNYLELDDLNKWPKEKKILLYKLLDINDANSKGNVLDNINVTTDYIMNVESRLNKGVKNIPFVDVMDVRVLEPDTIKISVYEKVLTGYVKYLDTYMYFDKDGCVVENSNVRTVGVPQITGLHFDYVVLDQPLPVENRDVFDRILNVTKFLQKYTLSADRLHFNKSGDVTAYFGEIKVALGSDDVHLEDKIMLLPELLPNLGGKKGTLQMISYDENSGKYIFKPE